MRGPQLAVDLSTAGLARLGLLRSGADSFARVEEYRDATTTTLTAAFMDFAERTGATLAGAQVAIAIAGVAGRDVVPISRSRWTLSRAGLDQFFGHPVTILNEVAAKAWSALNDAEGVVALDGAGEPAPRPPWRRLMVSLADGLGLAIIDAGSYGVRILETEAGHMSFSPREPADDALVAALRADGRASSWERALAATNGVRGGSGKTPVSAELARRLGDFVADVMLATGAWDGAYLTGPAFSELARSEHAATFLRRLRGQRSFARIFARMPCWVVRRHDAVLHGCGRLLAAQEPAR